MIFLTPMFAAIAAAIAIPSLIILYFLKLRRRDVEVSSTLLWKKAIEDLQANAPFQKLRNNILLLLQLLALLAGLFAIAQPQINSSSLDGERHIIMIDRSASMQATDGEPLESGSRATRLEVAKKQALALVDQLKEPGFFGTEGDQAMVIAFDTTADIAQAFTSNKVELRRAIEAITPTDSRSSFVDAFKLAQAHVAKRVLTENGSEDKKQDEVREAGISMELFSDGRLPDMDKARLQNDDTARDRLVYHMVGDKKSWNTGIITMRAEREYDKPSKVSVFVSIETDSTTPRGVDVQLAVEGSVVAVKRVNVPAAPTQKIAVAQGEGLPALEETIPMPVNVGVVFELDRSDGGIITAQLIHPESAAGDRGDVLKLDDKAFLSLPPAKRLNVAVVTPGNLWLRVGLEGMNLAKPAKFVSPTDAPAFIESLNKPETEVFDVVILDRWLPTVSDEKGVAGPGLPPGRWLVLGTPPPPPIGLEDVGPGGRTVALSWKRDHAAIRGAGMEDLTVDEARTVEIKQGSPVASLADGQFGPLVVEASDLNRRAIIVSFNPLRSNWPVKSGSLIFLAKSLEYLARDAMDMGGLSATPGQTLSQRLPRGASSIRLALPDSSEPTVKLEAQRSGDVVFGPLKRVGVYTLSWDGPAGGADVMVNGVARRAVSVNLADAEESDVSPRQNLVTASRVVSADQKVGGTKRLWPYLLLAMLGVLVVEWYVYNRKVAI